MRTLRFCGLLSLVVACLAGSCSGEPKLDPQPPSGGAAARVPACAKAGSTVPRPAGMPADFPLPPGTVITFSQNPHQRQLLIGGVIPTDLRGAASFFVEQLPANGYQLGEGDAEQDEAEAPFTGNGFRGKWKVNGILNCPTAVTLTLVLIRQS